VSIPEGDILLVCEFGLSKAFDIDNAVKPFHDWYRDYKQEYEPVCEHGNSYDCKECEIKNGDKAYFT
jgi:hypothetical protein